jgi:NAD(P)-dependent dehydrogenase (short-subunit alcohol dehydrogenase family)
MKGLYVVAGATGAIGRELCFSILKRGATPLLVGRSVEKLSALNDELGGGFPIIGQCDFANPTAAGIKLAEELKGQELRGMAYAVGSITLKPIRSCKENDFLESFQLNVVGCAEAIKACLPGLKKGGTAEDPSAIVLFSSVAARHGLSNHSVIGASKAAVEGLTLSLAAELAPSIRVNCVAPSLTGGGSEMAKKMTENEKIASAIAAAHPLPRLGKPLDSANAATFLLSSDSSWTTGMILAVDGGRSSILK